MKLGVLSDAHGNVEGLDRCLTVLERSGAQRFVFLGDSVGYLPDETRVLERLRAIDALCLRGNHEEMLLGNLPCPPDRNVSYKLDAVRSRLAPEWLAHVARWPLRHELVLPDATLLLVHGSPLEPATGYVYPDTDMTAFESLPYRMILAGHTHRPFIRNSGTLTFVNVGSCGLPRDAGNLASCATLDTATLEVEILRVEFDVSRIVESMGDRISADVARVLQRPVPENLVGRVVHV